MLGSPSWQNHLKKQCEGVRFCYMLSKIHSCFFGDFAHWNETRHSIVESFHCELSFKVVKMRINSEINS